MKKKTILITLIYMAILAIFIAVTVVIVTGKINNNKAFYYIAKVDLESGTTIDETMIGEKNTYFVKAETTKKAIQDMQDSGSGALITNLSVLKDRIVTDDIKAGFPVSAKNFTPKATTKDNTVLQFERPTFIELTFSTENILAKRLYKGQRVAVVADVPMSNVGMDGNWIGALTNYAEIYQTSESKSGTVVELVCEYDVAVEILTIKSTSSIYIVDNNSNNLDETKAMSYDIIKAISSGIGVYDEFKRNKDAVFFKSTDSNLKPKKTISLMKTEEVEVTETVVTEEGKEEEVTKTEVKKEELPLTSTEELTYLALDDNYSLSWYGTYAYVWLDHKTLANKVGRLTGKYSSYTNDVVYDHKTEINSLNVTLEEGLYTAYFYEKVVETNEKGEVTATKFNLAEKTAFFIEKEREHFTSTDSITLNFENNSIVSNVINLRQYQFSMFGLENTNFYEISLETLRTKTAGERSYMSFTLSDIVTREEKTLDYNVDLIQNIPNERLNDATYTNLWKLFNGEITFGEYFELTNNVSQFKITITIPDSLGNVNTLDILLNIIEVTEEVATPENIEIPADTQE